MKGRAVDDGDGFVHPSAGRGGGRCWGFIRAGDEGVKVGGGGVHSFIWCILEAEGGGWGAVGSVIEARLPRLRGSLENVGVWKSASGVGLRM